MTSYIKSFMPGAKKKGKLTDDAKRELFQNTVETLYATERSWRTILLEKSWQERIFLLQQKGKIEKILQTYRDLTKN